MERLYNTVHAELEKKRTEENKKLFCYEDVGQIVSEVYEDYDDFKSKNPGKYYFFTRYGHKSPIDIDFKKEENKDIYLFVDCTSKLVPALAFQTTPEYAPVLATDNKLLIYQPFFKEYLNGKKLLFYNFDLFYLLINLFVI